MAVDPVTSQKSTVTVLRCARGAAAAIKGAPQPLQKPASPGFSRPQVVQVLTTPRVCLSYNPAQGDRRLTASLVQPPTSSITMPLQFRGPCEEPGNCRLGD